MLKKIISVAIVCAFALTLLVGCGQNAANNGGTTKAQNGTSGATMKASDIKVGFIYVGPVTDNGWTKAHDNGRAYLEDSIPGVKTMIKESVPEGADALTSINEMIDQGCNVIFTTSFGYMDPTEEAAKEHPDVKFFHCSGYKQSENMSNYFGRMYEARYLSGIVAGLKTKTGKIGYVAATPIAEVFNGVNAFTLGVQSVRPDAKVIVRWSNTWYDPVKEKEAADACLNEGIDVMTLHNDSTAIQVEAQDRGVSVIGYNLDIPSAAPKAYMTAPIWNWGPYYADQVKKIMDGTWKSESYSGGLSDGLVDLATLTSIAPADAKAKVEEVRKKIIDGSFKVFTGPIKDQTGAVRIKEGEVLSEKDIAQNMDWFVQGVEGSVPKQ